MQEVKPDRSLSRWNEMLVSKVSPVDVYKILKSWKDNGAFDADHISAISRDLASSLNDLLDVPEGGSIVYHPYSHSYTDSDEIIALYGERLVSFEEMRDSRGYLQQYRVILKGENND